VLIYSAVEFSFTMLHSSVLQLKTRIGENADGLVPLIYSQSSPALENLAESKLLRPQRSTAHAA
jgi:hypothetical protein